MKTVIYESLPPEAMAIRTAVFIREQGFTDEYDETDKIARHIVIFDGDEPVATCRFFPEGHENVYLIGRVAVVRSRRGEHLGAMLLREAEEAIRAMGGTLSVIHSQMQARGFYLKEGYTERGVFDFDESCPHTWVEKKL